MKRINCFLLSAFLLIPLLFLNNTVHAMPISQMEAIVQMETIVADSRGAVDNALAQLESTLRTNDQQAVHLAQQALDLAVANYAIASESLAKIQAGQSVRNSTMLACSDIASGVNSVCNLIAAGDMSAAQAAYTSLPRLTSPGQLPAGLADIEGRILAASTEAASVLSGSAGADDGLGVSTETASPI
jgi:hypothetical protein